MPDHTTRFSAPRFPPDRVRYLPHAGVDKVKGAWACALCGCPHDWTPTPDGEGSWLHAVESRRCPTTFEAICPHCNCSYECAVDCPGMADLLGDPRVYVAGIDPDSQPSPPAPSLEWFSVPHTAGELEAVGMQPWDGKLWLFPAGWASAIPEGLPCRSVMGKMEGFVRAHNQGVGASRFGMLAWGLEASDTVEA